ncbi:hypothetical protein KUCAC02_036059, partial [Chaenocephalus aceratus]
LKGEEGEHDANKCLPLISVFAIFSSDGCIGVQGVSEGSNTSGPRCLNSGPEALICAYQRGTDNPWHSLSVNQEQIHPDSGAIAVVA